MKIPAYLKPGDTIGIVSPAGQIARDKIYNAKMVLESKGFKVKVGKNALNKHYYFAGTDKDRATDFQAMLDNPAIKAILCSRGGYGTIRIMEHLDFSAFKKNPKWIIGYSDITTLHAYLNHLLETCSLHATMPKDIKNYGEKDDSLELLIKELSGENNMYRFDAHPFNTGGKTSGVLMGGNLSVICSLRGTIYDMNPDSKILFIEEIGEYLYSLDRMIMNLKAGGVFDTLNGVIVGDMTDMKDGDNSFAESAYHVIHHHLKNYDFPVIYGFRAGHIDDNYPLVLGREIELEANKEQAVIKYMS